MQPDELREVFQGNLKAMRTLRRLTQAALAAKAGMHQPHIASLERGTNTPTMDTLARLAAALETTPDALLTPGIFSASTT